MEPWAAILMALAVPVATFVAALISQRKALTKEYAVSLEARVTRLENDLKACEQEVKLCERERWRLGRDNFQLMQDTLRMTTLLRSKGIEFESAAREDGG